MRHPDTGPYPGNVAAATILAIGYFIADTPGATTYTEAVQLRGMTLDQAAEEIRASVARASSDTRE